MECSGFLDKYEKYFQRARSLESELCDCFGVSEPKHFHHIVNNLLGPMSAYADLYSLKKEMNERHMGVFRNNLYHLIQYMRLLKKDPVFAMAELVQDGGFFPSLSDSDPKKYVQYAYESLGGLDHNLTFMKS